MKRHTPAAGERRGAGGAGVCCAPTPQLRPPPSLLLSHHPQACAYGKDDIVRDALSASPAAASTPDGDGYSPLQWASLNGRATTVALLLGAGADVN